MALPRLTVRILLLVFLLLNCIVYNAWATNLNAVVPHIKVVAIIPADSPPTYFIDPKTNKPSGFAVDIINRIAELSGMDVSYIVGYGWQDIIAKIRSGEADLIPEIGISEEREKDLSFTTPLDTFPVSMFVRAQSSIKGITKGLTVGTIQESFAYEKIRNVQGIRIITYKSYSQGLYDLLAGRVDAFACPAPVCLRLAMDAGLEDAIKIAPNPLGEVKRAIAVRKDNKILLERLNKAVEGFVGSEEYRQIYQKWYGKPASSWTGREIMTVILGGVILTFVVMLFWRHISVVGLKERYRKLVELTPNTVYIQCEGKIAFINSAGAKLFGASGPDQLLGRQVLDLIHPDYREIVQKRIDQLKRGNVMVPMIEQKYLKLDGTVFDAEVVAASFTYKGKPAAEVVARDITERKKAYEKLENLRRYNELILNSAGEGILGLDQEGKHTFVNPSAAEMLGYSVEELIGKRSHEIWHHLKADGSAYSADECLIYATLKDGAIHRSIGNEVFWRKEGSSFPVSYTSTPIIDKGSIAGAVITFRDITERKQAEEDKKNLEIQLFHAQKMEAVGQLAGGVAHDFNNIIGAIIGFGTLIQMKIEGEEPVSNYLDQIFELTERAATLTKGLLSFSRKEEIDMKPVKLNDIVRTISKFLGVMINEAVKLRLELSDTDVMILADSNQIDQILMNLAINARDSMPDGGILTINTELFEMDDGFVEMHGYGRPGKYGVLSVGDTGEGMDEKITARIFEPFFTTKEVGKGTGLGLAIVYGIVKQHNGYINVYSEPGSGTTFRIYLPSSAMTVKDFDAIQSIPLVCGSETILVADDADSLRNATKIMLEECGYSVIEALDGEDAVAMFAKYKDRIDLVLIDVVMPKKNGKEAYQEILKIKPDIKVIFTSGYTGDIVSKSKLLEEGLDFISKPISPRQLLSKIRDLLDQFILPVSESRNRK